MSLEVKCPTCQDQVKWGPESPFRPFCSERCRLIDLGEWADESRKIKGSPLNEALPFDEFDYQEPDFFKQD
ncbi:DNA gyrase inhibitor YacG [Paraferrimonas sp. SM1919]|uniref:DNA gyrase inhibitor YacG n=1 Tax=Paraferrimonas sp. SM1919 TaxID=2662263 RepID=UPI0013D2889E|nr:DNA gyrase inhibitor YacG [Paraferrimonas sp. SM1919]